ncbi:hypothetical protein EDB85DRAFT_1893279 [Lactarius pseudohatsudake]|nr:hypothetical protein EDB85DRAFT_1893279 [Lactarius pseudohatsudake]
MGRVQRARGRRGREGTGTGSEGRPAYAMKRRGQESEGGMTTTMAAIARRWRRRMQWACRTRRRNQGRERRRQPGGQGGGGWSDHRTGSGLAELAKCGRARRLLQGESDGGVSVPSHEMARSGSGAKRAGGLEEEVDVLRECEGRREERRRRREGRPWHAASRRQVLMESSFPVRGHAGRNGVQEAIHTGPAQMIGTWYAASRVREKKITGGTVCAIWRGWCRSVAGCATGKGEGASWLVQHAGEEGFRTRGSGKVEERSSSRKTVGWGRESSLTDGEKSAGTGGVHAGPPDGARASFLTRYVFKCMWEDCGDWRGQPLACDGLGDPDMGEEGRQGGGTENRTAGVGWERRRCLPLTRDGGGGREEGHGGDDWETTAGEEETVAGQGGWAAWRHWQRRRNFRRSWGRRGSRREARMRRIAEAVQEEPADPVFLTEVAMKNVFVTSTGGGVQPETVHAVVVEVGLREVGLDQTFTQAAWMIMGSVTPK